MENLTAKNAAPNGNKNPCQNIGNLLVLQILLVGQLLVCGVGVGLNGILIPTLIRYKAYHSNIRVLVINFAIASSIHCIFHFLHILETLENVHRGYYGLGERWASNHPLASPIVPYYHPPTSSTNEDVDVLGRQSGRSQHGPIMDAAEILTNQQPGAMNLMMKCHYWCSSGSASDVGRIVGIMAVSLGQIAMAFERFVATIKYKRYEHQTSYLWVAFLLIVVQWILTLVLLIPRIFKPVEVSQFCMPTPQDLGAPILFGTTFELFAVVFYVFILRENRRKQDTALINRELDRLSRRYQLRENIRATLTLLPSVIAHAALFIIGYCIMAVVMTQPQMFQMGHPAFPYSLMAFLVTMGIPSFVAMLFPLITFIKDDGLRACLRTGLSVVVWDRIQKCIFCGKRRHQRPSASGSFEEKAEGSISFYYAHDESHCQRKGLKTSPITHLSPTTIFADAKRRQEEHFAALYSAWL